MEVVSLSPSVFIAIIALALVALLALFGLVILGLAVFLWMRSIRSNQAPHTPPAPEPSGFDPEEADDPATEVFDRGSMYAIYDADELDRTELVRLDGGILIDGRTDPAVSLAELRRRDTDKD